MQTQTRDAPLSWSVTALAAAYVIWYTFSLSRRMPVFGKLFAGLGADVPLLTQLALVLCTPAVLWSICAVVIVLLTVKELVVQDLRTRVLISIAVFMATAVFAAVVTEAVFEPLLRLISHISGG